ncbi:unnamed protein product [Ambrosiozyma monospora]|uniref:Unnamed protein product n=1 Tax=Ambrosiozyma monospora TaxID=43982 RepID=A0ACB5STB1_AMBMO|nr:unnamed protein product [Ambrosiozyma monospora]
MKFLTSTSLCSLLMIAESLASPVAHSLPKSLFQYQSKSPKPTPSSSSYPTVSESQGYAKFPLQMRCFDTWEGFMYLLNLTIGSDNQSITLQIDTGSSDIWVISSNNSWCSDEPIDPNGYSHDCSQYGTFSATDSGTWKAIPEFFEIRYADGSGSNGTMGQDTLNIEGVEIKDVYFANCDYADTNNGVFGISYPFQE